jgi:F-type H+-transporting ATPase subunit delta
MHSRVARRYAKALLDLARERGVQDEVRADLNAIAGAAAASPELAAFLPDYVLPAASRQRALEALFADRVLGLTWQFLQLLEERRRLMVLPGVCVAFCELHDRELGLVHAMLASAFELPEKESGRIVQRMEAATVRKVLLKKSVIPELLGGFRVQVEDRVYDLSLSGALESFRRQASGVGS